jgi:hypothetical protein
MAYVALILKVVLCISAFVSAFLGVFRKTIDDQKRLTNHGKVCVACVFVTLCIGVSNELLNLNKEAKSSADKRAADDRAVVMQVKLDRALDDGKKRGEEAKAYMLEAESSRKKLEAVQAKLDDMDARISDPTIRRMLNDVKKLTGNDIALTGERISLVSKVLADVHDDLADVRLVTIDGRDASRGARNELASIKLEIDALRSDVLHIKSVVIPAILDAGISSGDVSGTD